MTWSDQLQQKLSILNPELDYCAIVVDEVEPAKKVLELVGLPKNLLHPLYELKECTRDFHYEYVLCVENWFDTNALMETVKEYDVPRKKILNFAPNAINNFLLERSLRYFKEHAEEFEIFATGISFVEKCLDATQFKRKLFNFGRGSQDLYYDFQVAKRAVLYGRGYSKLRYALIGLAPYSFYYDHSKTIGHQQRMWQYLIAFRDLRNFYASVEDCEKIFRPGYLNMKLPLEPFDFNDPYLISKKNLRFMTPQSRLEARKVVDAWNEKNYPETRAENIKILDDYLTLCEENHIRPIMFLPPMTECYKKYFNKHTLDEFYFLIRQACKKHSAAIFIDGWKLQGLTDADFYDVFHLNIQGAVKFSTFLNDFIEKL